MTNQTIYTVGGTVQAGGGIYIKRKADDELLQHCRAGDLAFILSSRQVGKSSLMVRTARQLDSEKICSVIIDLSSIGVKISTDEWYLGILNEIATALKLKTDIFAWWSERAGLGPAQRLTNFFRDVLLKEVSESVVLFFDEIDSTLSITFADDFFAALRAVYNARSITPDFKRLSFVLVGVATPSDLISDSKRTPFNIGERVDLNDFTLEEAMPLARGLGENAKQILAWIFDWSGGHPYLTQRLCAHLSKQSAPRAVFDDGNATENTDLSSSLSEDAKSGDFVLSEGDVAQVVEQLFIGEDGQNDNNLQFVRDMLVRRSPDARRVLITYKNIRAGKKVADDERSIIKAHLKISGVVNRQSGQLVTRNRIYERAFDPKWIQENTPSAVPRRIMLGSMMAVVFSLLIAAYFGYQAITRNNAERANIFQYDFQTARDPQTRLKNLSSLFELKGYSGEARTLFNQLTQEEKLNLFVPINSWNANEDQVIVTKGIYQSMTNTEENNALLRAMRESVKNEEPSLTREITAWLEGREELNQKRYVTAVSNLNVAVGENGENPALYYDRAQAYVGLGKDYYPDALNDLQKMILLNKNRRSFAINFIHSNLSTYWDGNKDNKDFEELAKTITTPMVLIPAGEFTMGSTAEQVDQAYAECRKVNRLCARGFLETEMPQHRVVLDTYYIDQYEVTNERYAECVAAGICNAPTNTRSWTRINYYGNEEFDNYPVIYVSWFDANIYCEWRGARLPTEAEWEKAARGTDGRIYPWGNELDGTKANFCDKKNCNGDVGKKNYFDDGYADTAPIGSYEDGKSPFGVYDMAGNVWEWVADWYMQDYYQTLPKLFSNPLGPATGIQRIARGGSAAYYDYESRSANRSFYNPTTTWLSGGFRCALSHP